MDVGLDYTHYISANVFHFVFTLISLTSIYLKVIIGFFIFIAAHLFLCCTKFASLGSLKVRLLQSYGS